MNLDSLLQSKTTVSLFAAREVAQLEFLKRLSSSDLKTYLAFKGGTALHLIYQTERFSEDLDFSLTKKLDGQSIMNSLDKLLAGEDVTDKVIKRRTVLYETRQVYRDNSFRLKLEINTNDIVPGEVKTMFAVHIPASFTIGVMRLDWMVAQKVHAFINRKKARDLFDFWFILKTKLPLDIDLVASLAQLSKAEVTKKIETRIEETTEREIITDLNPFLPAQKRDWSRRLLKEESKQLLRAHLI